MVTQNGDARYHPPDSRHNVKRPRNPRGPVPHPLNNAAASAPPPRHGTPVNPYRAYQPSRSPAYPPTNLAISSRHPNMPYSPPTYRSPTYPVPPIQEGHSTWLSRNDMERRRPPPQSRNPRMGLKPTASTTDIRTRHHSPFRLDQIPTASSPALPRFPHHHHSPELHIDNEVRSSSQSAMTGSSVERTSGTERSSVGTKNSSLTDLSPDASDIDGGMSVDDAISMYLNGFSDDPTPPAVEVPKAQARKAALPGDDASKQEAPKDEAPKDKPLLENEVPIDETSEDEASGTEAHQDKAPNHELLHHEAQNVGAPDGASMDRAPIDDGETSVGLQEATNCDTAQQEGPTDVAKPKDAASQRKPKELIIPPALPGIVPPPRSPATPLRDQYGFQRTATHFSTSDYDTWNDSYSNYQEVRRQKWEALLKECGLPHDNPVTFPPKSSKVKRYVRKGIPPEYRGTAWFYYAGGYERYHRNPGRYRQLVENAINGPSDDDKEHIERDLHRTFPDNIHFKPDATPGSGMDPSSGSGSSNPKYLSKLPEAEIIQSLRRVLYAFAAHNPKIGYTQSLNFIAGMLLLFLPEEKAFWMLDIITSSYLPGTHEISLEGANIDLWILMVALKDSLPAIYTKVASTTPTTPKSKPPPINTKTRLPDITLGLTNWLMSMFIGSLPLETTLRVWDIFFYEGSRTFFRVALAIFKSSEKEILALNDPMEIFQIVQSAPKKLIDASALADECFARKFRLTQTRVEELRAARKKAIREEKDRLSLLAGGGNFHAGLNGPSLARTTSPLPTAWRSLKKHTFKRDDT
ncbi:hypothetical protein AJ79_06950 [Helicocarpus griseus UAMH5409]|uniref:Rab-GAP TBC domain-containing protein n=1 Tax=Helicocarpus griseus UAMH5409 TaxID=1447875 RepID=A0A2B7X7C3_9EURO|nr:hypothetical protein AJ79_06950 [Helicocarpus griseus UAMH5409]